MDRDEIQRRDFPTGRRGYDPAAVDQHLRRVADHFDLQLHQPPPSLSSGTSEQVRVILEAAERSAAELRLKAGEEASDHVARVQQAADGLLAKLGDLETELFNLLASLRTSGERLVAGLADRLAPVGGPSVPARVEPVPEPPSVTPIRESDEEGARLIALNMALGGSSREDTAAYLADHFALDDPDALLDDVYARAGK